MPNDETTRPSTSKLREWLVPPIVVPAFLALLVIAAALLR